MTEVDSLKLRMLSKMVFLFPHPKDEQGNSITLFRKKDGTLTTNWSEIKEEEGWI